jgi:hypothetical protein
MKADADEVDNLDDICRQITRLSHAATCNRARCPMICKYLIACILQ